MIQERQRVAALVSGGASTVEQILWATLGEKQTLPRTEIATVITSHPEAMSPNRIQLLSDVNIPLVVIRRTDYSPDSDEEYGEALLAAITPAGADILGQYGHTPKTPENVVVAFEGRSINQHHSPVNPDKYDFGGRGMSSADRGHAARLVFVRETKRNLWTDVVAQRVAVEYDKGKVLKRGRVPILSNDTVDSLKQRAIEKEWEVQIATLHDFEEGTVEELPLYDDLVLPDERDLLIQVKRFAKLLYPSE